MLGLQRRPFTLKFDRVIIVNRRERHVSGLDLLELETSENGIWSTEFALDEACSMIGNFDVAGIASGIKIFEGRVHTKWFNFAKQDETLPQNDNGRVDAVFSVYAPEFLMRDSLELFSNRPISLRFAPTAKREDWLLQDYREIFPLVT